MRALVYLVNSSSGREQRAGILDDPVIPSPRLISIRDEQVLDSFYFTH